MLKGYTKEEKSWMMYDWANSAHSVIVVTLLPIFFFVGGGLYAQHHVGHEHLGLCHQHRHAYFGAAGAGYRRAGRF